MTAKIIKIAKEELTIPITNCINKCISSSTFPDELKIGNIILVYRKKNVNDKTNHRPINLLSIFSQIFEKVICSELETVANKIFSPKLCGFRTSSSSKK